MKSILTIAVIGCILFFSSPLSACENCSKEVKHSLHKGSCALQFALTGDLWNLQMEDLMGSFFSGKIHLSDKRAIRMGIQLSGGKEDRDGSTTQGERRTSLDRHSTSGSISLVLQPVWYLRANDNIHFNVGIGPNVSFGRATSSQTNYIQNSSDGPVTTSNLIEEKKKNYFLGVEGTVGVELFLKKNLSFTTEFHPSLGYGFLKSEYTNRYDLASGSYDQQSEETRENLQFNSNAVRIGLSFYF